MSYLLVGDLHLTDRPRDAYRFGIFKWIAEQQAMYKPEATFIMGDLCDQKDRHPAKLVNKITTELLRLRDTYILMGNHDYIDPKNPFFDFLNQFDGISFIAQPSVIGDCAAIPHCRTQEEFDQACWKLNGKRKKLLLLHNTFSGAISETNKKLSGLSTEAIHHPQCAAVYAGDVHKPQRSDGITYVGAPYHIRFGDDFEPRCLLINPDKELYFKAPRKWKLTVMDADDIINNHKLRKGDQVKVVVELAREEAVDWKNYRKKVEVVCDELELELYGVSLKVNTIKTKAKDVKLTHTPAELLSTFCKQEGLGTQFKEVGQSILEGISV